MIAARRSRPLDALGMFLVRWIPRAFGARSPPVAIYVSLFASTMLQSMMRLRTCAIVLSAALAGCLAQGQANALSLEALARDWTGSSVAPRCAANAEPGLRGPSRQCEWPILPRGRGVLRVSGRANAAGQLVLVAREEDVTDRTTALRIRDSLSVSMRAAGLREYRCPKDDRQWRSAQATVHMMVGATFPNGLLRIAIFATTETASMPDVACPGALPMTDR